MQGFFYFLVAMFLYSSQAFAVRVAAQVNKNLIAINENVILTIQVADTELNIDDIQKLNLSQIPNFSLVNHTQSEQNSIQIINGSMSKSTSLVLNYYLQAKKQGVFYIPSLALRVKAKNFNTPRFRIKVVKKTLYNKPQQSQQQLFGFPNAPAGLDIFNSPFFNNRKQQQAITRLKLKLSKTSIYKGELLQVDWFILSTSGIPSDVHKPPRLKNFWKEELRNIRKRSFKATELIDQVVYKKNLLNSVWLVPLKTGQLNIDPYIVRIRSFFSHQNKIKSFLNKTIFVKKLPSLGKNASHFTGAVGDFKMKSSIKDFEKATVNQPLSYKIIFKGFGHPRFISLTKLPFPNAIYTYPTVKNSKFFDSGQSITTFEILIVPQEARKIVIPAFTLSSFNPKTKSYRQHHVPAYVLNVKPGKHVEIVKSNINFKNKNTESSFEHLQSFYWPQFITHKNLVVFWIFFIICLSLIFVFLYLKNHMFKQVDSVNKKVQKHLAIIQGFLDNKQWNQACLHIIKLNYFVLYEKQTLDLASDWKKALKNLPKSMHKAYAHKFESLFKQLEELIFGNKNYPQDQALKKTLMLFKQTKELVFAFLSDTNN